MTAAAALLERSRGEVCAALPAPGTRGILEQQLGCRAWTLNSAVPNHLTSCLVMLHRVHALHFITGFAANLCQRRQGFENL